MPDNIITRMGDGARVELSAEQVKEDILAGTLDAADRGKIPELNPDELEQLFEIFADTNRIVAVKPGEEVITTDDAAAMILIGDQADGGVALPMGSMQSVLTYERVCCADTAGIGHTDYSCKPVKPIVNYEKQKYYSLNQVTTIPLIYGTQPNLGQYFQPDGAFPNPSELLPVFFFKQKTAYEISECDWSSEVCSSDPSELQSHSEISYAVFCLSQKIRRIGRSCG